MTYPDTSRQYQATPGAKAASSFLSQHELYVKVSNPISWVNDKGHCIN